MRFDKIANPIKVIVIGYPSVCLKFVWRQSGFAFFSALTSVGALFLNKFSEAFYEERNE